MPGERAGRRPRAPGRSIAVYAVRRRARRGAARACQSPPAGGLTALHGRHAPQPHRTESFELSQAPLFIDKVRDIVGDCTWPGQSAHPVHGRDNRRHGHDVAVRGFRREDRTRSSARVAGAATVSSSAKSLDTIEAPDRALCLIPRQPRTHRTALIRRLRAKRPRFHLRFTPTGASLCVRPSS